jgi:uncharacterized protein (TIGR03435 family)
MNRTIVGSSLILGSFIAFAQTKPPAPLSFEVASLKPTASPGTQDRVMRRLTGGPGSSDPGTFTYTNVTLKILATMAYNLKDYQVQGPEWIDGIGYDLIAKMPPGTTKEQAAQMMQTLLAERFKMEFHRETKPMPVFALLVGKGGPKMKEVEAPAAIPDAPPDGRASLQARAANGPGVRMMMSPTGIRLTGQMTMEALANALVRQLARPVLDQTELSATYDVDITWMPDEMDRGGGRMPPGGAMPGGPGGPGGGPGGPGGEGARTGGPEPALTLAQALQEKLGLKLDARKSSAEMLIIDRAEKVPVEN